MAAIDIERCFKSPSDKHDTYLVTFFNDTIRTLVTHDPATVSEWITEIESIHHYRLNRLIVGLDVEWRPCFTRHVQNPVATIQLCVGRRCLIYQLMHSKPGISSALVEFLNKDYTFVGVGIQADLDKLEKDYGFGSDTNAVDLRRLVADEYDRKELRNAGLKALARIVLEKDVPKPKRVTMSRWDNRRLTVDQVKYACVDAFVSFEIGRVLDASD